MTEFSREYGEGLYALCAEEKIDRTVLEEMTVLKQAFKENEEMIRLLGNMSLSKEERLSIADGTFSGRIHQYTLNFIKILVERGAIYEFPECASAYENCFNRDHQVTVAEVVTAKPLNEAQRKRLESRLRQMTGKEIVIKEKIDPSVMGGVLLNMDGKRYDNTLRGRLEAIKQYMAGEQ